MRAPLVVRARADIQSKRRRLGLGGDNVETGVTGTHETKKPLYHCNYCNKDISGIIRMKCEKCPDFDLCLECFSVGVEVTPHKSNHPYRIIDNLNFPLIHPDWTADEEILLLEGVETYGLGNWGEVSEHVATKTKTQCYDHYMSSYMNSPYSPLPDMMHAHGKSRAELLSMAKTHPEVKKGEGMLSKPTKQEPSASPGRVKIEEKDCRSSSGLSFGNEVEKGDGRSLGEKSLNMASNIADKNPTVSALEKGTSEVDAVGTEDGSQGNRSVGIKKPKPVADDNKIGTNYLEPSGYNPKRQEFDIEYDNEAELPLADMEFKENDTETDRELKLRMLHIYLSRLNERKRRKKFILERGLLDVKRQQELDRKRSKEERELYQRARVFMRYHSQEEHEALLEGLSEERRIRQRISDLQECRSAGCRTLAEAERYRQEKKQEEATTHKTKDGSIAGKGLPRSGKNLSKESDADTLSDHVRAGVTGEGITSKFCTFNITGLPGTDLLSQSEQCLCSQNTIFPATYLRMKEVLILESIKNGPMKRLDAHELLKADPNKVDSVFNFLVQMGWIQIDEVPNSS